MMGRLWARVRSASDMRARYRAFDAVESAILARGEWSLGELLAWSGAVK